MANLTEFAVTPAPKKRIVRRKRKKVLEDVAVAPANLEEVISAPGTNPAGEMKMDDTNFMGEISIGVKGRKR